MNRPLVAFALTPLVPSLLFAIAVSAAGLIGPGHEPMLPAVIFSFPIWLALSLPVSYGVVVLAGVPAFLAFRRLGWLSRAKVASGACIMVALVGVVVAAVFADKPVERLVVAMMFAAFGAATGHVFWRLAVAPPPPTESCNAV